MDRTCSVDALDERLTMSTPLRRPLPPPLTLSDCRTVEEAEARIRACLEQLQADEVRRSVTVGVLAAEACGDEGVTVADLEEVAEEFFVDFINSALEVWRSVALGAPGSAMQSDWPCGKVSNASERGLSSDRGH